MVAIELHWIGIAISATILPESFFHSACDVPTGGATATTRRNHRPARYVELLQLTLGAVCNVMSILYGVGAVGRQVVLETRNDSFNFQRNNQSESVAEKLAIAAKQVPQLSPLHEISGLNY